MQVASLHIYPVKSFAAVDVGESSVAPVGLDGDRRLMLVDADGRFVSQREDARLARLRVRAGPASLSVEADGLAPIEVSTGAGGERLTVTVWHDEVDAVAVGDAADAALSAWLARPVRLVAMDARSERLASPDWAPGAPVGFADGFPVLVTNSASLDDLNARIESAGGTPVPMARFRPNIVVAGAAPWAEDGWTAVRVGAVTFDFVKPCSRCIITTTDQRRGERDGEEPLRTLATFRRSRDRRVRGVVFGWNAVPRGAGVVRSGDPVAVLGERTPWPMG